MNAQTHEHFNGATPVFYDLDGHDHPAGGSTALGFWMYLMSDCLIFAILFACYAVLGHSYGGGPGPQQLFELPLVALNTAMLLLSSLTCRADPSWLASIYTSMSTTPSRSTTQYRTNSPDTT